MPLTNVIKGVPLSQVFHRILDGVEHLFIANTSGSYIHINTETGVIRIILNNAVTNSSASVAYSQVSNCFYFNSQTGDDLLEYNPNTGETHTYQIYNEGATMYVAWGQFLARYNPIIYAPLMSTGGHIYLGQYPFNNLHGYTRFNVLTKELI